MVTVRVDNGEPIEKTLRRFRKKLQKAGVIAEYKKKRFYESPSERRKRKSTAAAKRKKKAQRQRRFY